MANHPRKQTEVLEGGYNLHLYPASILQLVQPFLPTPLSHYSTSNFIESPHIGKQFDTYPTFPVQLYPLSLLQFELHPVLLKLSHC